jgi:hypothetical protein
LHVGAVDDTLGSLDSISDLEGLDGLSLARAATKFEDVNGGNSSAGREDVEEAKEEYRLDRAVVEIDLKSTHSLPLMVAMPLSMVEELAANGYCLTTLPERSSAMATSVTVEVPTSVRKKVPVLLERELQQTAFWPSTGMICEGASMSVWEKSKVENPTPASVARTASLPGMSDMEKGRRPPFPGVDFLNSSESEPSAQLTSQVAMKPGVGGRPLTEAWSLVPSSEKRRSETEPAGPVAGVVWLRPSERTVLGTAWSPFFELAR